MPRFGKNHPADLVFGYGTEGSKAAAKIAKGSGAEACAVVFDSVTKAELSDVQLVFAGSRPLHAELEAKGVSGVSYLPPAVPDDSADFIERRAAERAGLKLEPSQIAVCVPGPIYPDLGHAVAIEAIEQLAHPQLKLFLMGGYKHPFGQQLRLQAEQTEVAASSMIGHSADSSVYAAFDICLAPFQSAHAAPHALTAMSFGLPLVGSPLGALQDMVTPASNGYLATTSSAQSLAEALLVTLDEGTALIGMGKRSRRAFKEQFSLRAMSRALLSGIHALS